MGKQFNGRVARDGVGSHPRRSFNEVLRSLCESLESRRLMSVVNVIPQLDDPTLSDPVINEGGSTTITGTFTDPGAQADHTVTVDWGDGTSSAADVTSEGSDGPPEGVVASAFSPINGHTYYVIDKTVSYPNLGTGTWAAAEAKAAELGGHLATIRSQAEQDWIWTQFRNIGGLPRDSWIGINDVAVEGQFVWSSGEPVTYTNWGPGEPSNNTDRNPAGEDWGQLWASASFNGRWNDVGLGWPATSDIYGIAEVVDPAPSSLVYTYTATHIYLDNPSGGSTFPIVATVDDNEGGVADIVTSVEVHNLAPSVSPAVDGRSSGVRGQALFYDLSFTDAGIADTASAVVDWGDGTQSLGDVTKSGAAGAVTAGHIFVASGTYTVKFTVTDDDGGASFVTKVVQVGAIELQTDAALPGKTALAVGGTTAGDVIAVSPYGSYGVVEVVLNGVSLGRYSPTGRIVVYAQAGDDRVQFSGSIANPTWVYGDAGDDRLNLGNGGGLLFGGDGNDDLLGGNGRDVMVGGGGADRLVGNSGDDILIAGFTTFDNRLSRAHEAAWAGITAEWNSSRCYLQRVANLDHGVDGFNGATHLNDATLRDDTENDAIDTLNGGAGDDWFIFHFCEDRVTSIGLAEFLTMQLV